MVLGIYGAGGLGREVLELARIINEDGKVWNDIFFIVDGGEAEVIDGCIVYEYETAKLKYNDELAIVLGIGEPAVRERIVQKIVNDNIPVPSLIHPSVHIPKTSNIGKGVIIQFGCFVSVGSTIRDFVFLQPNCAIGHDSVIEDGCVISTFDSIAGGAHIGKNTYIGMGVSIKEHVNVGKDAIIGMGAVVFKDIDDEVIAMGNPARAIKKNYEKSVFKR